MLVALLVGLFTLVAAPPPAEAPVERVAFGSCLRENRPAPIWEAVNAYDPDVFVFLGDNIYADTDDRRIFDEKYAMLGEMPGFKRLRDSARILAIWDDHDFGKNDAGSEWHLKDMAKAAMLDFFGSPTDNPDRRARTGNYDAVIYGPPGRRVQFILLDTRYFRSPLKTDPEAERRTYVGNDDPGATVLGEEQWAWLRGQLEEEADVRVICTSIQLLADEHRFEKWANFPQEREKLMELLKPIPDAIILSGDRHSGEFSVYSYEDGRVLVEVTASALNQGRRTTEEANRFRNGPMVTRSNFGTLTFDWNNGRVVAELRGVDGRAFHALVLDMAENQ
jgi:alkaline phosphatase D